MIYFLIGYLFLMIFRPYEYWEWLGQLHVERIYVLILLVILAMSGRRIKSDLRISLPVFSLLVVMALSGSLSAHKSEAFTMIFEFLKNIIFYYIILHVIENKEQLRKILYSYIGIMMLYSGKSAWEFFIHDRYVWRMGIKRMIGIDNLYGDPNAFAASIIFSLPILWVLWKDSKCSRVHKTLLLLYAGIASVGILFSRSRAGFVAALLFMAIIWIREKRKLKNAVLLAIMMVVVWGGASQVYKTRIKAIFIHGIAPKGTDESAMGRVEGLKQGIKLFMQHPLLGVGPGNFIYYWEDERNMQPHNLVAQILSELGALGMVSFLAFLAGIYGICKEARRRCIAQFGMECWGKDGKWWTSFFKSVNEAYIQVIILLLFIGCFGNNLYRYNWLLIAALVAITGKIIRSNIDPGIGILIPWNAGSELQKPPRDV